MHNNTCLGTYLYSVATHHGNLLKSLATMSRMTYSVAPHGKPIAETNAVKIYGEDQEKKKEKKEDEQTRKFEIRTGKKFLTMDEAYVAIF